MELSKISYSYVFCGIDRYTMKNLVKDWQTFVTKTGGILTNFFHYVALFAIGSSIVWSAAIEFFTSVQQGSANIESILLLFIYLELGAMVGIYFKTKRLPVRFLIYVAITALTRMLVGLVQQDHGVPTLGHSSGLVILYIAVSIFILAASALVIRYGSAKYPSSSLTDEK
ncbi:MAG: protein PsiE [Saprospiraceae bacterium]|jgi:protein PsiE